MFNYQGNNLSSNYVIYLKRNKTFTEDINCITSIIEKALNKKACIHKLWYNAPRDGNSLYNFHKNCDRILNALIIIIETIKGKNIWVYHFPNLG